MKKTLTSIAMLSALFLAACGNTADNATNPTEPTQPGTGEVSVPDELTTDGETTPLVLITDYGGIDDGSFNQGSWEGLVAFATANNINHHFIRPADVSDAEYLQSIYLANSIGAELIVTPGFLFEASIYNAQDIFPDTKFVLLDGDPRNPETEEIRIEDNTVAVHFAEEEAGFLAGYAIVLEGHRSLGFIGGIPVPAVVRFGHGFVLGAEYAAAELGLAPGEVTINYNYAFTFTPSPSIQTMAASWYNNGVEVIFAAAGGGNFSVASAAENSGGLMIGVDSDQSGLSDVVITSALKDLSEAVYQIIDDFFAGNFPGGQSIVLGAKDNAVGLPMETSRFTNFTQEQYDEIFARVASGDIEISTDVELELSDLGLQLVSVDMIS